MKFHFKSIVVLFMLLNSTLSHSRNIILIENLASIDEGQMLLRIVQHKFNIPKKLVTYRNIKKECMKNSDAIMHLCLKANGEMDIVKINKFVIEETFRIFAEAGSDEQ